MSTENNTQDTQAAETIVTAMAKSIRFQTAQRPGGNTSIALGGNYGGDGDKQFGNFTDKPQSKLKAPTNIPKIDANAPKVASPKAKPTEKLQIPTRRAGGNLRKSMGMQDSLSVLNFKESTMATGKHKGQNNIDASDIEGSKVKTQKFAKQNARSLVNQDIEGSQAKSNYKERKSTYDSFDYSDVPKKAQSKLMLRGGDVTSPSFAKEKPDGSTPKPRTRDRKDDHHDMSLNVSGIDGAGPKQHKKWKQRPIYTGEEAGPRRASEQTKQMVKGFSGHSSAKQIIFSGAYYKNDDQKIQKPKGHQKTLSAGHVIFMTADANKPKAAADGDIICKGDPAISKILNSGSMGSIMGNSAFGGAPDARSRNKRIMADGPSTHSSGSVANIGQSNCKPTSSITGLRDKNAFSGKVFKETHSFGGSGGLGQSVSTHKKNAYTGRGYQISHSFGGAGNIGQSVDPTIKPSSGVNPNRFASSGVSALLGGQ